QQIKVGVKDPAGEIEAIGLALFHRERERLADLGAGVLGIVVGQLAFELGRFLGVGLQDDRIDVRLDGILFVLDVGLRAILLFFGFGLPASEILEGQDELAGGPAAKGGADDGVVARFWSTVDDVGIGVA